MSDLLLNHWLKPQKQSLRDAFGESLVQLGKKEKDLVVLTADLARSTRVAEFQKRFPSRFFQVGVAEQNLVGLAAGLAMTGWIPFCCSFASFLTGRAWEQIRICLCQNKLPVKLVGSHAGLSHPSDGMTAQATEDIALMRSLPGMAVVYPADSEQMKKAVEAVFHYPGAVYLRMTREPTAVFLRPSAEFQIGQAQVLKKGKDITFIGAGPLVYQLLLASRRCRQLKIDCEVINLGTIKPLDKKTIIASLKKTGAAITIEDHQRQGGLGSAVAAALVETQPVPMEIIGLNQFGQTARSYRQLLEKYDLTVSHLVRSAKRVLDLKRK